MEWNAIVINGAQMVIPVASYIIVKLAYDGAKQKKEPPKKNGVCSAHAELTKISTENHTMLQGVVKSLDKAEESRDLLFQMHNKQVDEIHENSIKIASLKAMLS